MAANDGLAKLVATGVLTAPTAERNRVFAARDVLDLLAADLNDTIPLLQAADLR